jgi:hypothetical protein
MDVFYHAAGRGGGSPFLRFATAIEVGVGFWDIFHRSCLPKLEGQIDDTASRRPLPHRET